MSDRKLRWLPMFSRPFYVLAHLDLFSSCVFSDSSHPTSAFPSVHPSASQTAPKAGTFEGDADTGRCGTSGKKGAGVGSVGVGAQFGTLSLQY